MPLKQQKKETYFSSHEKNSQHKQSRADAEAEQHYERPIPFLHFCSAILIFTFFPHGHNMTAVPPGITFVLQDGSQGRAKDQTCQHLPPFLLRNLRISQKLLITHKLISHQSELDHTTIPSYKRGLEIEYFSRESHEKVGWKWVLHTDLHRLPHHSLV